MALSLVVAQTVSACYQRYIVSSQAVTIRKFLFDSEEYRVSVALRSRVLREPLGLRFTSEELKSDAVDIHVGAFLQGQLVGSLILTQLPERKFKMRQVAIDFSVQRLGIGRKLVEFSEALALEMGIEAIVLNSRESAERFYQHLGYDIEGERFTEVSIPHIKMKKPLKPR
jgi:predicted GNAT family N-acyltransferase